MPTVELDRLTFSYAAYIGVGRHIRALMKDRTQTNDKKRGPEDWGNDIEAACAECAYALWANMFWMGGGNRLDHYDVGHVSIKHTVRPNGRLLIAPEDAKKFTEETPVVLVVGTAPVMDLVGWLPMGAITTDRNWNLDMPRPCWAVTQGDLRQMEEL